MKSGSHLGCFHFAVLLIGTAFLCAPIELRLSELVTTPLSRWISPCMAWCVPDCSSVTLTAQATDRRSARNPTVRSKDSDGRARGCAGVALRLTVDIP